MAINFPDSPAENDSFTSGGKKWIFNGTVWTLITANSYTIPTGEVTTAKILDANVTAAKLASGAAVSNIGYTPANVASPTFTGTVVLPSTTSIGTVTSTEIGYVDGVTSAIQTQLDSKLTASTAVTSGRNAIINGNMDVWQRGTSFTISTGVVTYTADRWQQYFNGGGTITQETTVKPATSLFSLKMTATATSGDNAIYQLVEEKNMAKFKGKTVTLSVKLAGTATINPGINLAYSTTADDFLTNTSTAATVVSTTSPTINASTFVTYTRTFTVPTTAKTLRIGINSGSMVNTNVLYVAEVQLEAGAVATPFEFEDAQVTLAKCQRYFEKSYNVDTTPGTITLLDQAIGMGIYTNTPAAYNRFGQVYFKVSKRAIPTVTQYAPWTGSTAAASNASAGDGSTAVGYTVVGQLNHNGFNFAASVGGSTVTNYNTVFFAYTASAEL